MAACLATFGCSSLTIPPGAGSAPEAEPAPAVADARGRIPAQGAVVAPRPAMQSVALLYSGSGKAVADAIAARLAGASYSVARIPIDGGGDETPGAGDEVAAVAVGLDAAALAKARRPGVPVVFCEVFDYRALLGSAEAQIGVSALPPPGMLLRAWKATDPSLGRIGVIVSEGYADLAAELVAAARTIGIDVAVERSASDRETLYLFRRMAAGIDGFWLLPDAGILSPGVIRELLEYALSHDVGVLAFNEALLNWGALLTARSRPADVSARVLDALGQAIDGDAAMSGRVLPLSEARVDFNAAAARRLGLTNVPEAGWVLREPD